MNKIRKGDEVVVIAGKDKGRRGAISKVFANGRVLVENVNMVKKHQKPNPTRGTQGGIVEQEDSEAWIQQFRGASIDFADDRPFYYGLGLGEETTHPELPGLVSGTANELYARSFFERWRADLEAVEEDD